jgi:hypothetical protein
MGNAVLTPSIIAREALAILENNLVMGGLVHTDYSNEFMEIGDTLTVRKPASFTAVEFDGDLTGEKQDIKETSVAVKLDKIADVSVDVSSKEMTLEIKDFAEQVIKPAVAALVQKVDYDLTGLYIDVPYFYGASGATPDELTDISQARKVLNVNKVPVMDRNLVIDPEADAKFSALDIFARVDATGSTAGLVNASLGKKLGMDMYMDQNIRTHTAGLYTVLDDVDITAGALGATTISLESSAGGSTATLLKGDLFTIDDYQFVVTADTADAVSGDIAVVKIYPALPVAFGSFADATLTFLDATANAHVASIAFHKNAFALVSRPLQPAMGGANSYATAIKDGINMRVTMDYNMPTKTNTMSFDILYGVKTLYPELAARLLG